MSDVIVSVVVIASAFAKSPISDFHPAGWLATTLVLLPILIIPWRRRWPVQVLIVLLVLFGVVAALGTLSPGIGLSVGVAVFQVAYSGSRRRSLLAGSLAAVAIMLLTLLTSVDSVVDPRVFQFGLVIAFATAAGDGTRSRREYILAITERAERAVETREAEARRRVNEERLRIARDLHDVVAHQIAVISLSAGVASSSIAERPEKARESLAAIRGAARTVLRDIGDLMAMLRSDDQTGSVPAPQAGLARLDDLVAQFAESGLHVVTRVEGDTARVTGAADLTVYWVLQEALTNAHKHGVDGRAHVLIQVEPSEVSLTVTNPISSRTTSAANPPAGLGLLGIGERIASVRGRVEAGPVPAGWKVLARVPLAVEDTA